MHRFGMKSRKNTIYQLNNTIADALNGISSIGNYLIEALDAHLPTFDRSGMAENTFLCLVCQWKWKFIIIFIYRE